MAVLVTDEVSQANRCWACGNNPGAEHFCPRCGKIQPLSGPGDYFVFLGIPARLGLDEKKLQENFYSLSRKFHPDYFQTRSAEEKAFSLDRTSFLNKSYQTLRDPEKRALYLFELEGLRPDREARTSPELLEEVFEIQELAAGLPESGDSAGTARKTVEARKRFENRLDGIAARMKELFAEWDASIEKEGPLEPLAGKREAVAREVRNLIHDRNYIEGTLQAMETSRSKPERR